ncbi:YfdX family protein [Mesorhizobium sp. WSM2239]|uniref:YfdX family protein n=2 Tax=unclassified Mesorhizobium TaxID=325217 RepID=A0AAU8DHC4_9HYPH
MQRNTLKSAAASSSVFALAVLMGTTALVGPAAAAPFRENTAAVADSPNQPGGQAAVSLAAAQALRHITSARRHVEDRNFAAADQELGKALGLLDLVQSSLPSVAVKDQIRVARRHLEYESTEEVMPDLVPIYSSLERLVSDVAVEEARQHIDRAKANLEKNDKNGAMAEFLAAGETLVYKEVDLPLGATRRLVTEARQELQRKDILAVDAALKAAEDDVVYLSAVAHEPLAQAHQSLWQAAQKYAAGAFDAAKAELDTAIGDLDQLTQDADEETRRAAQAMLTKARSLRTDIEANVEDVPSRLDELWKRAKAVSERSAEYIAAGLQRAGTKSDLKADLIEAKLHLSYAEIARFTTHDVDQAAEELGLSLNYMDQAVDRVSKTEAAAILAIHNSVEDLATEPASDQQQSRFVELEGEISRMIEARADTKDDTVSGGVAALTAGDYDAALKILTPLAEDNNPQAAFWLGDMYEYGLGVPKKIDTALKWYRKSAEAGWTAAEFQLGEIYFNGTETLQDFAKAHKWLEQAAHGGNSKAQQDLGQLYAHGWGVEKDPIWAYVWYEIAAREGNYEAQRLRDELIKTMGNGDITEAQKLTAQIAPDVLGQG